ncbi:MAG TPA: hypothetical protein VGK73_10900 [Polyangiaceae bacterium]
MSDALEPGTRAFIECALREEPRADPRELRRVHGRIVASALAATSAAGAAQAAGLGAPASVIAVSSTLVKSLVVGMLAVGGGTLAATLPGRSPEPAPRRATTEAPAPTPARVEQATAVVIAPSVEVASSSARPVTSGSVAPSSVAPARASSTPVVAPLGPKRPSLGDELAVLRLAQARLNVGDGKGALRLLDETSVAHGGGQLGVERAVVEILAACKAGEAQRADRLARAFLAAHPDGPAAARVRASCAGEGR